ncbi:MAG: hypothetical protein WA160_07645 [Pseudobdellovibrio sp.]
MPINKVIKYLLIGTIFFVISCQTHQFLITESYLPVKDHRRAIVAAIGEARIVSQNGREITSHYHDRNFKYIEDPNKVKTRYYTKVMVLGARRPYEVAVEVHIENKNPEKAEYLDQGLDESLSQKRLAAVEHMLNQSRDKPQTIDVENPF